MKKHAVIYDRASTDMQIGNFSRFDAATTGRELAAKYGYTCELRQEIKSGESIQNREVLQSILDDVVASKVQAVIVQNLSRLTRDQDGIDGYVIKKILADHECVVITPEKVYDFSLDADDKAADIGFLIGRWYKADLVRNTVQGQKARAKSGLPVAGHVPYGYKKITITHSGKLTTDWAKNEKETEPVLMIFEVYPRLGARGTASELNNSGYTRRDGKPWQTVQVWRIIDNPLYCGFLRWGVNAMCKQLRDFEATCTYRPELAFVPLETWETCKRVKEERKINLPSPGKWGKHPLAGLLACPYCEGPLYGHSNGKYTNYGCITNSKSGKGACKGKRFSKTAADAAVIDFVSQILDTHFLKDEMLQEALNKHGRNVTSDELKHQIEVELFQSAESKNRLIKAVSNGTLSENDIKREMQDLRDKEARLNRELKTIDQKVKFREDYLRAVTALQGEDIKQTMEKMEADTLKQFFRLIFKPRSIKLEVVGRRPKVEAEVICYEFTEDFQELIDPNAEQMQTPPNSPRHQNPLAIAKLSAPHRDRPGWWAARLDCVQSRTSYPLHGRG